jgi:hypothetical protein
MKTETDLLAEIIELKACLIGMLEQFGTNFALSAVEDACALLKHPRTQYYETPEPVENNDCCYCREVVYDKKEAKRRRKIKLNFVDRTNVKR